MSSEVDESSRGKESSIDINSSTAGIAVNMCRGQVNEKQPVPLTALLRPLRESLSHLRNSWEGVVLAKDCSSALDAEGEALMAAGTAGGRVAVAPFTRGGTKDAEMLTAEAEVARAGRGVGVGTTAPVFPLGPTVVQVLF